MFEANPLLEFAVKRGDVVVNRCAHVEELLTVQDHRRGGGGDDLGK